MWGMHMLAAAWTYPQTVVDLQLEFFELGTEMKPFVLHLALQVKNNHIKSCITQMLANTRQNTSESVCLLFRSSDSMK